MSATMGAVAGIGLALYVGHYVGDYWVQTDREAKRKGEAGWIGRLACLAHVGSYVATQTACLALLGLVTGYWPGSGAVWAGLAVSGVTHYLADRRERGLMFWLARRILGKAAFLELGRPRPFQIYVQGLKHGDPRGPILLDNPTLGTGAGALDQAWHFFFGVFIAALVIAGLS